MTEFRLYCQQDEGHALIDTFATVEAAVRDARQHWNDSDETRFWVTDGKEKRLVEMTRDRRDPEVCRTRWPDGRKEAHRCHYMLDDKGWYSHTSVIPLASRRGLPC